MKKLLLMIMLNAWLMYAFASEYKVGQVVELTNDISARTNPRYDEDEKQCAILKFNIPSVEKVSFEEMVGDVSKLPGEYTLYLKEGTPSLTYHIDGSTEKLDFADYGVSIEGKKTYRVTLTNKSENKSNSSTRASISANQDGMIVLMNGIPMGETPLNIESITPGSYTVSVPFQRGYTMNDTTVLIEPGKDNPIVLSLHETSLPEVEVEIAVTGGDTAGNYERWGISVIEKDGKKGVVDLSGNVIVPCEFERVNLESLLNGYYSVWSAAHDGSNNEKSLNGLYAPGKGMVVPCEYEWVRTPYLNEKVIEVKRDGKWGALDENGKLIVPIAFERITCNEGVASLLRKDNCYDLFDYQNKQVICPAEMELKFYPFNEGYSLYRDYHRAYPSRDCDIYGIIDRQANNKDLPYGYEVWGNFYDDVKVQGGLFPVKNVKTGKIGFMNPQTELVIPAIYEDPDNLDWSKFKQSQVYPLLKNVHYGSNRNMNFKDGVAVVLAEDVVYVIDKKGKALLDSKTLNLSDIVIYENADLIKVTDNSGTSGLYDKKGREIIPLGKYAFVYPLGDENIYYCCELPSGETHIYDKKLDLIMELPEDIWVRDIKNGMALYQVRIIGGSEYGTDLYTDSYGYLNLNGDILATGQSSSDDYYSQIINDYRFSEGLAIINIGDLYGYINNKGEMVVPMVYTAITPFEDGVCFGRNKEGNWIKINRKDL